MLRFKNLAFVFAVAIVVASMGANAANAADQPPAPVATSQPSDVTAIAEATRALDARTATAARNTKPKKSAAVGKAKRSSATRSLTGAYGSYYIPCTRIPSPPYGDILSCAIAGYYDDGTPTVWKFLVTTYQMCSGAAYQQGYTDGCFPPYAKRVNWWYRDGYNRWIQTQ